MSDYFGMPKSYDAWKTACCERYPNCNPCPYDETEGWEGEDDEDEDDDEEFD